MKKAKNWFTYDHTVGREEVKGVSKTVPNMAYTPKEILVRFGQGLPVPGSANMQFGGEEFIPDMSRYDLTEQEEILKYQDEQVEKFKRDLDAKVKARKAQFNEYKEYMEHKRQEAKGSSEADDIADKAS